MCEKQCVLHSLAPHFCSTAHIGNTSANFGQLEPTWCRMCHDSVHCTYFYEFSTCVQKTVHFAQIHILRCAKFRKHMVEGSFLTLLALCVWQIHHILCFSAKFANVQKFQQGGALILLLFYYFFQIKIVHYLLYLPPTG